MDADIKCYNCFFWSGSRLAKDIEREQGNCHRFPIQVAGIVQQPNMVGGNSTRTVSALPMVHSMQWCGEFQPVAANQSIQ